MKYRRFSPHDDRPVHTLQDPDQTEMQLAGMLEGGENIGGQKESVWD